MLDTITEQFIQNTADAKISPLAVISPSAHIGKNVKVGPYAIIEENVDIGDNTEIGPHAYIKGSTVLGKNNKIFYGAVIGEDPQDLKYQGEYSQLIIGDNNTIREYATIHRGTKLGGGITKIGHHNLIMSHVHIAHDVQMGDHIVLSQNSVIGGHVFIHDFAIIGGLAAVHQFVQVGMYSMIGGCSRIIKDILPFSLVVGNAAKFYGLNIEGLRRKKFSEVDRIVLKKIFAMLNQSSITKNEILEHLTSNKEFDHPHAHIMINFLKSSTRGVYRTMTNRDEND